MATTYSLSQYQEQVKELKERLGKLVKVNMLHVTYIATERNPKADSTGYQEPTEWDTRITDPHNRKIEMTAFFGDKAGHRVINLRGSKSSLFGLFGKKGSQGISLAAMDAATGNAKDEATAKVEAELQKIVSKFFGISIAA